jgi:cytochrome c-type biogenesis protein
MAAAELGLATYGLSFVAGNLSTLSPCVLPLIPILVGTAMAGHRMGPLALGGGLALSFATTGTLIASLGNAFDFDPGILRLISAWVLVIFGLVMVSTWLQEKFAAATAGLGSAGNNWIANFNMNGLRGQFLLGLLLGLAWSPCVGPTLGVAIGLASQGKELVQVSLTMLLFGLGASLPIVILGMLSREGMQRAKGKMATIGNKGKKILGGIMLLLGILIVSGQDKHLETAFVNIAPDWLINLSTSI